jgi:hypothetical protein
MTLKTNYSILKSLRGDIKLASIIDFDKLQCTCKSNVHSQKSNCPKFNGKHKESCFYYNYPVWI